VKTAGLRRPRGRATSSIGSSIVGIVGGGGPGPTRGGGGGLCARGFGGGGLRERERGGGELPAQPLPARVFGEGVDL
jgi:hypothetical protein